MEYTTKDLAEGKVVVEYKGNLERLRVVLKEAFPKDRNIPRGKDIFYFASIRENKGWCSSCENICDLLSINENDILLMSELTTEGNAPLDIAISYIKIREDGSRYEVDEKGNPIVIKCDHGHYKWSAVKCSDNCKGIFPLQIGQNVDGELLPSPGEDFCYDMNCNNYGEIYYSIKELSPVEKEIKELEARIVELKKKL